jgi:dihydroflavonol-4-reductase
MPDAGRLLDESIGFGKVKVLVVGASGHLGAHLTRELLANGREVRALVRPSSDIRSLRGLDLEIVRGDVTDPASLARAMRGCRHVYHLGAPTSLEPGIFRTILAGTRHVLEQALSIGVERVVYTSSIVTIGYTSSPAIILDERSNALTPASKYHVAKWHAERLALDFSTQSGLPVIVVNPSAIVGPLDFRVTPSDAPIQRCLDRGLPVFFRGGLTVAHAQDVARGHLLAMEKGIPGQRYILGGDNITIQDYFGLISELCGRRGPTLGLPQWIMLGLGCGFSLLQWINRSRVPFTYDQAKHSLCKYGWYSSEKARVALGYSWRCVREAVASYIGWVRSIQPVSDFEECKR